MAINCQEKLWVDDNRPAPEGWTWIKTFTEARKRIVHPFAAISLDWNLGYSPEWRAWKTGEDLLHMLGGEMDFEFTVSVHTSSPKYRPKMIEFAENVCLTVVNPPIDIPLGND